MRAWMMALAAAAILVGATAGPVVAHPGHDHKVMGAIVSVDGRHVTMKTTDGKELTFEVTPQTKLLRAKKTGELADLKAGLRIVANLGDGEEPLKAKQVEYTAQNTEK